MRLCRFSGTSAVVVTVGIEESLLDQTISVYPNPNNGAFRVEFQLEGLQDVEIRVVDAIGREVYTNDIGNISGNFKQDIDLSDKAKGLYILQVISNGVTTSRKVTIQ